MEAKTIEHIWEGTHRIVPARCWAARKAVDRRQLVMRDGRPWETGTDADRGIRIAWRP